MINKKNYNEIIQNLASVIRALNGIEVKGKTNLLNLGGAIGVVEDVIQSLSEIAKDEIEKTATKQDE